MAKRASRKSANDYVPKDYDDLYRYYIAGDGHGNSLCHQLIRHFLPYGDQDERDTLAHDIFLRLMDKDMITRFDPSKANFGGVIYFVTRTVCINHLSKKSRNPITGLNGGTLATKDPEDDVFEPGVYSLDRLFGTEAPNHEEQLHTVFLLNELTSWAKSLFDKPRHKRDRSLYPLIKLLREQHDPRECGEELGVTSSTISNWMEVLRKQMHEIARLYS